MSKLTIFGLILLLSVLYGVISISGVRIKTVRGKTMVEAVYERGSFFPWPTGIEILPHVKVAPLGISKGDIKKLRGKVLKRLNHFRDHHGLPLFTINKKLNHSAQMVVNNIINTRKVRKTENAAKIYGETLAGPVKWKQTEEVVDLWWSAIGFLRPNMPEKELMLHIKKISYMTQMLWRASKEVGIGIVLDKDWKIVYVCVHYYPPGNLVGHFKKYLPPFRKPDIKKGMEIQNNIHKYYKLIHRGYYR